MTKIIEIHCCYMCPHQIEDEALNPICEIMDKRLVEMGDSCPPDWCPLEDAPDNQQKGD